MKKKRGKRKSSEGSLLTAAQCRRVYWTRVCGWQDEKALDTQLAKRK
jgi:hypothetical protein